MIWFTQQDISKAEPYLLASSIFPQWIPMLVSRYVIVFSSIPAIIMNRVKAFVQKIWTYDLVHTAVYSIVLELIVECFNRRVLVSRYVIVFSSIPAIGGYSVSLACLKPLYASSRYSF